MMTLTQLYILFSSSDNIIIFINTSLWILSLILTHTRVRAHAEIYTYILLTTIIKISSLR